MMKKKKIAFVLGSMGQGGAEKVISVLSKEYAEKGWDTNIIVLLDNRVAYDLHPTTRIIDLSGNTTSRLRRTFYWINGLRSYSQKEKPDIMLSFAARINILSFIACRKYVDKFFVSERNDPRYDGRSKIVDIATKIIYPKINGVVFQTKRAKEYFTKLTNGYIIPNPISVSRMASEDKKKKVVSVGCLKSQKNQKLLIDAFSDIAEEFSEYSLYIYGEGRLRADLEKQISSLGLSGRVHLPGGKKDVHEYIADAELFVLSSDYEGLSNALLEALMMGLPCVTTNCAGSDEYINDSIGLIVPVGDRKLLTKAIKKMLSDKNYRRECGKNAAASACKFDKKEVLSKWHELMDK